MTCCSVTPESGKSSKRSCPGCGQLAVSVSPNTIVQHIVEPWSTDLSAEKYYFCATAECDVVYFSDEGKTITQDCLRTVVGVKQRSEEALICYCFGVSRQQSLADRKIREFVIEQTKQSACACEVRNPSGRCCLKDFPKSK